MSASVDGADLRADRGQTRVMLLGGRRHRTVQSFDADPIRPQRPKRETIRIPIPAGPDGAMMPNEVYELTQFISGPWKWWAYVLRGYEATRGDAVLAKSDEFYRQ